MERSEEEIDILVEQAQNGISQSFGELYDIYLEPVYRYIFFRVSSQSVAEDITGEIFFKALNNLKKYKKRQNMPFAAWLFRIAKNMLVDHYRKQIHVEELSEEQTDEAVHADSTKQATGSLDKNRIVHALKELPEMQAQAIVLKYFSDRSNAEIAAVLEKSETAVRILQSRGLKKLKDLLETK
jgi:RNA polymerase sigma-70 factor (ECF subfamily)